MRAAVAVFFRFKGGVYLEPDDLEASGELCCFLCFDLAVLDVIILSQFDNGWKLSEFARHLPQAQKRNSYPSLASILNFPAIEKLIARASRLRTNAVRTKS